MIESLAAETETAPRATTIPALDDAVEAWWAGNPQWTPIANYAGGEVLFRTPAPARIFFGRKVDGRFVQIADGEAVDESLEQDWTGPAPTEFVVPPAEVAIAYTMQ